MAKKRNPCGKKKQTLFRDERVQATFALFILFLAAFLLLAFISYFFTWKVDQSFEWSRVISPAEVKVENWSGKTGAHLANLFISKLVGIPAFLIPFMLFIIGMRMLKVRLLPLRKSLKISLLGMILLSVTLGFFFGDSTNFLGSGPGGAQGYYVSNWLIAFIGKTGTAFLIIVLLFAFVIFSFQQTWDWINFGTSKIGKSPHANDNLDKSPSSEEDKDKEFTESITREVVGEEVNLVFQHDKEPVVKNKSTEEEFSVNTPSKEEEPTTDEEIKLTIEKNKNTDEETTGNNYGSLETQYDPTKNLPDYQLPTLSLLDNHKSGNKEVSDEELISNKNKIVETLANYKIQIDKIKATVGPTITLYEIIPAPGIRISKIKNLEDDIALSLAALGIRIIAPIPGKGTIGIEVPNQNPQIVSMRSILASKRFQETKHELALGLGKTISNEAYTVDLTKMPHLLVAGATGQGKSVGLNAIITSLLYKNHPAHLKFVLVDPKKVELTLYSRLEKHFLAKVPDNDEPIITDTQKVIYTLNSLTKEMDQRYDLLKKAHVRNIKEYNQRFLDRRLNPENGHRFLPYIVVIVDEFADLIMTAGKEVETPLARLAQLARAIGIHLIIATQRPTTNIITGVIKANFPARIAFRVTSMVDSRTILDSPGANQLIGRGDMLISTGSDLTRIQCAFVDIPEIERITEYINNQPGMPETYLLPEFDEEGSDGLKDVDLEKRDEFFDDAARLIVMHQQGSTSLVQRKLSIGYNRAGRIVDQLEAIGIIGPPDGSKAREVLITDMGHLEQILSDLP